jgi:predicted O-linked N-acetylglucosamine transferase (SPINDLY family)
LHRLDEAVACYRRAIEFRPDYAAAYSNLCCALRMQGNPRAAAECGRQAIQLRPDFAEAHNNLGAALQAQAALPEAIDSYRRAIELRPAYAEAHANLGNALQDAGEFAEATDCYRRALEIDSNYAPAYCSLGNALRAQGALDRALDCYQQAIQLRPDFSEAHCNRGIVFQQQGHLDAAAACYQRAIDVRPTSAEAHNNLGNIYRERGESAAATACYRRSIALNPDSAETQNNLAAVLCAEGSYQAATACCRRALQIRPDYADAHHNLGAALYALRKVDEAVACYRRAIQLHPQAAQSHACLADALWYQGRFDEALRGYDQALQIQPSDAIRYKRAICLPMIYPSLAALHLARREFAERIEGLLRSAVCFDPRQDVLNTVFYLAYQGFDDRPLHEQLARLWRAIPADAAPAPHARPGTGEKIRIGVISRLFKVHSVGELWRGILTRLSREKFAVTVFALGHGSDSVADFIRRHADRYCELPLSIPAARQALLDAELDVLFYTDIGMDPHTHSLAHLRLAPVQCVTWGHPVTTGLRTIDYFLSSELLETADAQQHYTERLVRLRTLGLYVYRPQLPEPRKCRADFGLPGDKHLYGCLQSLFKFHPQFDPLLAGILRRDPQGLLVLPEGVCPQWRELLMERFRATMPDVAERICWVPRQSYDDFLRLNALIDVLLVPPQFGGGKTSYEALALGVPVVTLPSPYLRGRITYALYRAIDVLDCVAGTPEEFVQIAVRLGTDPIRRQAVSEKILAASGRLFEDLDAVRELEEFFAAAVLQARTPHA